MIDFRHLALLPDDIRERCEEALIKGRPMPELVNTVFLRAEEVVHWTLGFAPETVENWEEVINNGWDIPSLAEMDSEALLELMMDLDMGD